MPASLAAQAADIRSSRPAKVAPALATAGRRQRHPIAIPWRERPNIQVREAAALIGCSVAKLYLLAHEGRIAFVRLAGRTLVPTASLSAFLTSAEAHTPSGRRGQPASASTGQPR